MANKPLISFIVRKYLSFDRTQPFISIAALLAFGGVAVGVMVLIIAMAIMNGMSKEFEKKLFTMNYPLTIYPRASTTLDLAIMDEITTNMPHLKLSPFITSGAVAQGGDTMEGVIVFGVDFAREVTLNDVLRRALAAKKEISPFGAVVGELIAENMVDADGRLNLYFTRLEAAGMGMAPVMKRFSVEGNFTSGLYAYDKAYVYTTLEAMRALLDIPEGMASGIHLYSDNPMEDAQKLREILPISLTVVGWWEQNGNFFAAMAMEKRALFIVLMLIVTVAAMNIISSLLMTVMNRRKEIALLLSLGTTRHEVRTIFFWLGAIIGGSGIVAGVILGFVGMEILSSFDLLAPLADVYGTSKLPMELDPLDLSAIILGATAVVLLSSWYPAKKASEIDVLTVLRNE
ncbi:MAG: ABC transporter permease [Campylobacterales bacterium]